MNEPQTQLIYSFDKPNKDQVHVNLRDYNGSLFLDIRVWFKDKRTGDPRPTKKGICLPLNCLKSLKEALDSVPVSTQPKCSQKPQKEHKYSQPENVLSS